MSSKYSQPLSFINKYFKKRKKNLTKAAEKENLIKDKEPYKVI